MNRQFKYSFLLAAILTATAPSATTAAVDGSAQTIQQSGKVKGQVIDKNGEPIIGASVQVKGNTATGAVTDLDGNFSISGITRGTLIVSYVGYVTKEVTSSAGQSLTITLEEDQQSLSEVVVVGYGTVKKANLTGSVAAVNFSDVQNIPMANTSTMLQGRLPGVVLQTNGAQAGHDDPEIRVRGVGTLGSGSKNNPMVLIDGIESSISQMSALAAEDIESVSVLKDAALAAI